MLVQTGGPPLRVFFQAEDGIRDTSVTGVQTCALPICFHTTFVRKPDEYEGSSFDRLVLDMDANTVFPRAQIIKGDNEKTIAELRATAELNRRSGLPYAAQLYTVQQKFSLPAACAV